MAFRSFATTTLNLNHVRPAAAINGNSPRPIEYTVGWICALPDEMAAAEGMLDEVFQAPRQGILDENIYAVGRIAHLKVVIGCLPYGVAGTTSATRVAEHMRQTFTALQYTLLVGVGGGIPSKEVDVRLGDVVVSVPSANSPGVIQYDYGKDVQNDRFVTTGTLNRPPDRLLIAVSRLRSQEASRSSEIMFRIARSIAKLQAKHSNSERQANLNVVDNLWCIPLLLSAYQSKWYSAYLLLNYKEAVNMKDQQGRTVLFWAIMHGQTDIVRLLISPEQTALNVRNGEGLTPLS
ncbi:Nucleoside phosphorylase superfamily [Fusarium oxysporum f. sp. vasinfectum]|nr:Nucleoside phosphorylase superfamily [Fusarium oxysporum f. sp. vasinfectum]